MAGKLSDFLKTIREGGAKSRVIIVLGSAAAIGMAIYFGTRFLSGPGVTGTTSRVANAPGTLQSVPGGKMSPEFYRAVSQANVQAAQEAQITGGSAVPTLLNVPGEQKENNCTILCSDQAIDVANDIDDLVKSGKLSQEEANKLEDLAKKNVTPEEYAAYLNQLVKEGKLTPEQARLLLEHYKKQYQNKLAADSAKAMDGLIKSGDLPVDAANQLLALQKNAISPADYADELNRLVKEGKISPQTAAALLAQYTQQRQQELAKEAAFALQQMAKSGQITPEVAADFAAMLARHPSVDDCAAELNRLVAAGKLIPQAAEKLLAQCKQQVQGAGASASVDKLLEQERAAAMADVDDMEKSGRISHETAAILRDMLMKGSSENCQKTLDALIAQKKISKADANTMMARCHKLDALRGEASKLKKMQDNKASIAEYLDELRKAVKAGVMTPQQADSLIQAYRTLSTAEAAAAPAAPPAAVSGGEAFAKLQQRLQVTQGQAAAPATGEQFEQAAQEASTEEAQARQQRIEELMTAMSGQAQQLLTAWQPPVMQHKEGAGEKEKKEEATEKGTFGGGGKEGTESSEGKPGERPLIKAGTILFAVLDTAVNSDYPDTPVMATIVQGDLKGAKLMGKVTITSPNKDRLALNFTMMNMDAWIKTKSVTAFAIDPDTAHTVLASSVDYHYLKRYGALFASSFMSGYASAVMSSGATTTTGIFGTSSTASKFSPGDKLAAGLGQVGTNLTAAVQGYVNTPPTVIINSGVGIGILFMGDVTK